MAGRGGEITDALVKVTDGGIDLAAGIPASCPATKDAPAVRVLRLHELRHTFAACQLSAGVHSGLGSKWLGHSTFTLTLDLYGKGPPVLGDIERAAGDLATSQ